MTFRYRLYLIRKALSWHNKIDFDVLAHHRANLPNAGVRVEWRRDGEYIIGTVKLHDGSIFTQGRTAMEFVEMLNDALYAAHDVPLEYSEALGGDYRLVPSPEDFQRLKDDAVMESAFTLD
jgi:hypothetical protein